MSRELPILFKGPLVRAILDGRKTQTRRVVKPQPPAPGEVHRLCGAGDIVPYQGEPGPVWRCAGSVWAARQLMGCEPRWRCPYREPGDLLWVRETFQVADCAEGDLRYAADGHKRRHHQSPAAWWKGKPSEDTRWRPSIHMPRWASRLTLRVTEVRVERLQDISEDDARAEGVEPHDGSYYVGHTHRAGFAALWDDLASEGTAWADNPWVWVVIFERVTLKPALRPGYGCPGCGWSDRMCDCPERFLRRRS